MKLELSICMIVKNEERHIERCLAVVKQLCAKEIIIVDTGSTDATRDRITKDGTAQLYEFEWCDDFAKARNYSFSKATSDWIMWLDADDLIDSANMEKLHKLEVPDNKDVVMLQYLARKGYVYYRERIVRRSCGFQWVEPVHEIIEYGTSLARIVTTDIAIVHAPIPETRNLRIFRSKGFENLTQRGKHYFARECFYHKLWDEAIEKFEKFLELGGGWVEDNISSCYMLASCYEAQGMEDEMLSAIFNSFAFDTPRPEACCRLGDYHQRKGHLESAVKWYLLALESKIETWGIQNVDFDEYYPALQLCVCYWHLGNKDLARKYHKITKKTHPESPAVRQNEEFFAREG
jgi:glycosyltransferase involved in cell wall biosynthesis